MSHKKSYTTEEIADILKVSKLTVYDLIKKGKLAAYRVGRQMRVDEADLEKFKWNAKEKQPTTNESSRLPILSPNHFHDPFTNIRSIIISGQDPSLDILSRHLDNSVDYFRPLRSYASSLNGIISQYNGEVDIASVHLFDGETSTFNLPYLKKLLVSHSFIVIRFINRWAGFYVKHGNPKKIISWQDIQRSDIKLLNREIGSGARTLLDEHLRMNNITIQSIHGYEEVATSHFSVAVGIAQNKADFGIGMEKINYPSGIDFLPLVKENYDLVILRSSANEQLIQLVVELLKTKELKSELSAGGYDISETGKIIYSQ